MTRTLDDIMEDASTALVKMDYLACESLCMEALAEARRRGAWDYYARVLLPLQESRRQRRIIAAEGVVALGVNAADPQTRVTLDALDAGSVVLTKPSSAADARALADRTRRDRKHVEVLLADSDAADGTWAIRSFAGPTVTCRLPAPPREWINRFLRPGEVRVKPGTPADSPGAWFVHATESLGDAALAVIDPNLAGAARVAAIEQCLEVVTDHEIIHQRLADAARDLARDSARA